MDSAAPAGPALFEVGRNCCARAHADRVALLVDGEAYFRAFARAAERASRSIVILAWDFSSSTQLHFDGEGRHGPPARLGDFLNWLARRRRTLDIRILDWDYPLVYGTDREFRPFWGFGWKPHRRVQIAYDNTHPVGGSHHQKVVLIDDALAFVGGFDLTDRRWDTPAHCVDDGRRRAGAADYPPFHDIMLAVDGEAAAALGDIARARWLAATGEALPAAAPADPWPPDLAVDFRGVEVAVARTLPAAAGRPEVREVEALYLDMIAAARRDIYIENQYFTAARVGDALAARLAEPDGPEVVLVLRLLSHGWLEEHTMHVLRTRLIGQLRAADRHGRFHLYYAHQEGLREGTCIDIHAKLMIVDDEILRVGSANLCNRSMGLDSECDAALAAAGDPEVARGIRDVRNRLLGEHLDVPPPQVEAEFGRRGGLAAAIAALQGRPRSLRAFDKLPAWPDAVIELASVADRDRPVSFDSLFEGLAPEGPPSRPEPGRAGLRLALFILALLGFAALWRYTPLAAHLRPERIVAWAQAFADRPWAPLLLVGAYTPACLVMFPRPLITLAAVVAFGPWRGGLYALAGVLLAALATYAAGRSLPRRMVRALAGHELNHLAASLRRHGLLAVTALRLVPVAPFAVLGLVAGAFRIRLWHFMLGSFFGVLPGTLATTVFGREIVAALLDPARARFGPLAAIAAAFVVLVLLVRRWLRRIEREEAHNRL